MNLIKNIYLTLIVLTLSILSQQVEAAPCASPSKVLKLATLAPQGTGLAMGLMRVKDGILQKTEGCVDVQVYAGGIAGDEKDVVRKMRIGQLHGAALTGVGLGMIEPEIRVLELPFLFDNYAQVDKVYSQMQKYFEDKFSAKDFELLGWAETGFVQIFSNDPIKNRSDLVGKKMWMWEGDALAGAMYDSLKVTPVPLAITDVLTSLQTGLINGAYAPALGAIAFQWHTKVKFVTKVNLVMGTGGVIVSKQAMASLTPAHKQIVESVIAQESINLKASSRKDNEQSLQALSSAGLQIVELDGPALTELQGISKEVQQKLVGKLYPQTLLNQVLGFR